MAGASRLNERQIEDVFEAFHEQLVEPGLKLKARQQTLGETRLRVDLLFEDRASRQVILELKRDSVSREDVGQILEYAGLLSGSRVILAAPHIATSMKTSFEHYGIEYIEFSQAKVAELYQLLQTGKKQPPLRPQETVLALAKAAIADPLPKRTLHDGNIAFKVTYNDRNWHEPCSADTFQYNVYEKRVPWCCIQAEYDETCQSNRARAGLGEAFIPCYDAVALKRLSFSPGWNHGRDAPHVCKEAKVGKIALLTSRAPGEAEDARFVFAILDIARVRVKKPGDDWAGTEYYEGTEQRAIVFQESARPHFWEFYSNPRAPDVIAWGAGLFRYVNDEAVCRLLESVRAGVAYSDDQKQRADALLSRY